MCSRTIKKWVITMSTKKATVLLFVIIVSQLFIFTLYSIEKNGFHIDEMWSYALSNSFDEPFFYTKGYLDDNNDMQYNHWMSGRRFFEYITVQPGEQFAYSKVYYNQSQDVHPPLYYFILHTVSSFFPNQFSKWFGIGINMVIFVLCQIILYALSVMVLNNKRQSLLVNILWGCSMAALNTVIFIRMYMLLTLFVVLSLYYHARLLRSDKKIDLQIIIFICITLFLGGLTHYYFIVFEFILACLVCLYLLLMSKIKLLLSYSIASLMTIGSIVALFPPAIDHLLHSTRGNEFTSQILNLSLNIGFAKPTVHYKAILQEILGLQSILADIISILILALSSALISSLYGLFVLSTVLFLILLYTVRRLDIKTAAASIKKKTSVLLSVFNLDSETISIKLNRNGFQIIVILSIYLYILIVSLIAPSMGILSDRYTFCVYPVVCIVFVHISDKIMSIFRNIFFRRIVCYIIIALCCVFSHKNSHRGYLFSNTVERQAFLDLSSNANCIYINYPHDYWLHCMPYAFMNAKAIFPSRVSNLDRVSEAIAELPSNGNNLLIFSNSADSNKIIGYIKANNNVRIEQILYEGKEIFQYENNSFLVFSLY